jgi:hypothetical protein
VCSWRPRGAWDVKCGDAGSADVGVASARPEPVDRDGPLLGDDLGRPLPGLEILAEARLTSTDTDGHDTGIIETTAIAAQDQHARITPGQHLHHASGCDPVTWTRMLNTPGNLAAIMVVPRPPSHPEPEPVATDRPGLCPPRTACIARTTPSVPAGRPRPVPGLARGAPRMIRPGLGERSPARCRSHRGSSRSSWTPRSPRTARRETLASCRSRAAWNTCPRSAERRWYVARQVMSVSVKPRLAGRQPSASRAGCPG